MYLLADNPLLKVLQIHVKIRQGTCKSMTLEWQPHQ